MTETLSLQDTYEAVSKATFAARSIEGAAALLAAELGVSEELVTKALAKKGNAARHLMVAVNKARRTA